MVSNWGNEGGRGHLARCIEASFHNLAWLLAMVATMVPAEVVMIVEMLVTIKRLRYDDPHRWCQLFPRHHCGVSSHQFNCPHMSKRASHRALVTAGSSGDDGSSGTGPSPLLPFQTTPTCFTSHLVHFAHTLHIKLVDTPFFLHLAHLVTSLFSPCPPCPPYFLHLVHLFLHDVEQVRM